VRDRLVSSELSLADARAEKNRRLASVRESKAEYLHEVEGLQAQSAALGATIRSAQTSAPADSSPSSSGLIWPVSGPVTSGFGWRWGRMHEGIDIGAASGTPIHAAAGGTVIYSGWLGGYGNLVVIDHHNSLATAYGHQSSIATGVGASVAQGQVIGYVGCTGHCFGSHLHFEVRVNGSPVDPLGYL
jgi:murein DD-endopeptidase MepM/ murein hydrolase activator NlpD